LENFFWAKLKFGQNLAFPQASYDFNQKLLTYTSFGAVRKYIYLPTIGAGSKGAGNILPPPPGRLLPPLRPVS